MSAVTQMTVGKVNSVHPRFSMNEQKYRLQGFFLACCTWADPRMLLFEGVNGVVTVWLQSMRRRGQAGQGQARSGPARPAPSKEQRRPVGMLMEKQTDAAWRCMAWCRQMFHFQKLNRSDGCRHIWGDCKATSSVPALNSCQSVGFPDELQ